MAQLLYSGLHKTWRNLSPILHLTSFHCSEALIDIKIYRATEQATKSLCSQSNLTGCNKGDQTCGYGGASAVSHLQSVLLLKTVFLPHMIKQRETQRFGNRKENSCQMELRLACTMFPETLSKSQAEGQ